MTRKRILAGIAVMGFVLAMGGNSLADDRRDGHHRDRGTTHHTWKGHHGHHHGYWNGHPGPHHGWGRWHHRPAFRHCPPYPRHQVHRCHPPRPVVRHHVHHDVYPRYPYPAAGYFGGLSVRDNGYAFSFRVGGIR